MKKAYRIIFNVFVALIGALLGSVILSVLNDNDILVINDSYIALAVKVFVPLIFAIIFYLFSGRIQRLFKFIISQIEQELSTKPLYEIIFGSAGLVIGLIIAFLLSQLINSLNFGVIGSIISIVIYFVFAYLGLSISSKNKDNLLNLVKDNQLQTRNRKITTTDKSNIKKGQNKLLDTSTIIDGRIAEIIRSGFIEGSLIVPVFVLEELQHIADSADNLKRNRGRRGLDIVNEIQNMAGVDVVIYDKAIEEIEEVDSKLIKLAKDLDLKIITNDYNLNKVAGLQGVEVLNINELANAVKPIAIPGEDMIIQIVKEGKEQEQGIAYLDDGTMIVVENGKNFIGETIEVIVTSVLQTNAGKMIFAKSKY